MNQAWFVGVTAAIHEDVRRIEIAMRVVEVTGADAQLERIDLIGDPDASSGAVFDAPGGFVDLSPRQWYAVLVGCDE